MLSKDQLIKYTLASFEAERQHDVSKNAKIIHDDFAVTDMVISPDGKYFPRLSGTKLHELIDKAFQIEGREFIFRTVIADKKTQTVVVEFVESYPDSSSGKVFRTPQVAICEFKDGRIFRTRHYMDPRLSYEYLELADIKDALS